MLPRHALDVAAYAKPFDRRLLYDVLEWDLANCSPALGIWADRLGGPAQGAEALEIRTRRGGLAHWLALDVWAYLRLDAVGSLFARFSSLDYTTEGLAGCFGRTERQRCALGKLDRWLLARAVPPSWHYVFIGVAMK
jgi:hypothetical protein